jgi:prepilin-type N-terminal cleavage/methylation domain-containing protein
VRTIRKAFTLIEVVVGLVLMATLIAASMTTLASHKHSLLVAKQTLEANGVADRLLTNWYDLRQSVPVPAQGFVDADAQWRWQTQSIGSTSVCGIPVQIIRLDVLGRIGSRNELRILCSIEVMQRPDAGGLQ